MSKFKLALIGLVGVLLLESSAHGSQALNEEQLLSDARGQKLVQKYKARAAADRSPILLEMLRSKNSRDVGLALDSLSSTPQLKDVYSSSQWSQIRNQVKRILEDREDPNLASVQMIYGKIFRGADPKSDTAVIRLLGERVSSDDEDIAWSAVYGLRQYADYVIRSPEVLQNLKSAALNERHPKARKEATEMLLDFVRPEK